MSIEYDKYLHDHINAVNDALIWMADNLKIPGVTEMNFSDAIWNTADHDKSKYDDEEYDAYDAYFYGGNRSYQVVQDFNKAWLHHIHNNSHHWQHWVLINDDKEEGIMPLEMPVVYVLEMIADWWSFSWRQGKLDEIFIWYAGHDNIKLHKNTKKLVEDIFDAIQDKLDEVKQDEVIESDISEEPTEKVVKHYGIEGMHWGERRFQYQDGSLTPEGKRRYSSEGSGKTSGKESKSESHTKSSKPAEAPKAPGFTYMGRGGASGDDYEKWENDLYSALMKSGKPIDISNMSDEEFKKLLSQYGVISQNVSPNLIAQMRKTAAANYISYAKQHPLPVKETASPAADNKSSGKGGGSSRGSSEKEEKSNKKEETEEEKKAKEEAAKKAAEEEAKKKQEEEAAKKAAEEEAKKKQEEEEAEKNKPASVEDIEKTVYDALKYSRYLSDSPFTVTELINDTADGFKEKISAVTGLNTSELKDSEVEDLRKKISANYGLDTWESDISEKMDMAVNKYPNLIGNRSSFMRALMDYTKVDLSVLSDSELKKMQERFAELYLEKNGEKIEHSGIEDEDDEDDEQKYGVPELKKFPMPDEKHVRSAIKFFNYVDKKYEKELAKEILERMEEYGMSFDDFEVGDNNRFKNYIPKE